MTPFEKAMLDQIRLLTQEVRALKSEVNKIKQQDTSLGGDRGSVRAYSPMPEPLYRRPRGGI